MQRLTKREYGNIVSKRREKTGILCGSFCNNCSQGTGNCKYVKEMVEKLAEYEDLEGQGLFLKLPCKVGDMVYEIHPLANRITPRKVKSIVVYNAPDLTIMYKSGYDYSVLQKDFGKTVFLTQTEAKKALKEAENE